LRKVTIRGWPMTCEVGPTLDQPRAKMTAVKMQVVVL
jgi:hypothetical protein